MIRGRCNTQIRRKHAVCPECQHWYEESTMVVINYGLSNQIQVCADCYEEKYFIPPEPLKKGE